MKVKKVNRYYCEFCKKSGCSRYHIEVHEKHCTANPNRECRMCAHVENVQRPLDEMIAEVLRGASGDQKEAVTIQEVTEMQSGFEYSYTTVQSELGDKAHDTVLSVVEQAAGGCPMCMLAIARALRKDHDMRIDVEFRRRRDSVLAEMTAAAIEAEMRACHHG